MQNFRKIWNGQDKMRSLHRSNAIDPDYWTCFQETEDLKNSFKLTDFIYVTRAYYQASENTGKTEKMTEKRKPNFFRFEDKIFESISKLTFAFPLQLKTDQSQVRWC